MAYAYVMYLLTTSRLFFFRPTRDFAEFEKAEATAMYVASRYDIECFFKKFLHKRDEKMQWKIKMI